jgi:hypothetical protein
MEVDNTPITVGSIVLGAALILVLMKRAGFRAVIGVSAGG